MIPAGAGGAIGSARGSYEYFGLFEGGVFQLASGFGWFLRNGARDRSLPLAERVDIRRAAQLAEPRHGRARAARPQCLRGIPDHALSDPAWARFDYVSDSDRIDVPALVINTWGDQTLEGSFCAGGEQARRGATPRRRFASTSSSRRATIAGTSKLERRNASVSSTRRGASAV